MDYKPYDQVDHLGPSPWQWDNPAVIAWEQAHGHDVRLECYAEYGCLVIEEAARKEGYAQGLHDGWNEGYGARPLYDGQNVGNPPTPNPHPNPEEDQS